jgi:UDPglucose--hexose-1-phosphate uridylyltransferase
MGATNSFERPHRRYNALADEWVLVSSGRLQRPWQGSHEPAQPTVLPAHDPDCYLCPGTLRAGGWRNPPYVATHVFDNDFPALRPDAEPATWVAGLLRAEQEPGRCRVVCFSPRHDLTLGRMAPDAVRAVIDTWADETDALGATYRWVQVFENRGAAMGASNPHPHGQIWATDALPELPAREDAAQRRHHEATGNKLLLDYAAQELDGPRVIEASDAWLLLVPYWAIWPFETLLLPRRPAARLSGLDGAERDDLASVIGRLLARYDGLFDAPMPYSMGWHQAPFDEGGEAHWQLHAHFLPPMVRPEVRKFMVGYELLSEPQRDFGPEQAAERLRAAGVAVTADPGHG